MSYRQLYVCCFLLMLSITGSFGLLAVALGVVSMPEPAQIAVEYNRPYHVHAHLADAEK